MSQDSGEKVVKLTIDGREVEARFGDTVLEVARQVGIEIPALCYHPVLGGAGACRVCMVEVVAWGRRRMVASCVYPAREGLEVYTNTEKVLRARRSVISMLLAKAPAAKAVQELAERYGVTEPAYEPKDPEGRCILCGQCVRTCNELIKVGAVNFAYRGQERKAGTPYDSESAVCLGCGACQNLCPTGNIHIRDKAECRAVLTWNTDLAWQMCSRCGQRYLPARLVEHLRKSLPAGAEWLEVCPRCRREGTAEDFARASVTAEQNSEP